MHKQSLSHFRWRGPCAYELLMINQQTRSNFASALPSPPSMSSVVASPQLSNPASSTLHGLLQLFHSIHQALELTSVVKTQRKAIFFLPVVFQVPFNHLKSPFKFKHPLLPSPWLSAQAQDCQHLRSASFPTIKSESSNQALAHSRTWLLFQICDVLLCTYRE